MDKVVEMVNQSWFWRYFFSHFGWVDWALLIFLAVGIFIGMRSGASRELPRLGETAISLYATFEFYVPFAEWLSRQTPCPEAYARVITFAGVGFASWFLLRLLFEICGKVIHLEVAPPFQMIGGILLGGLRYLVFFSLISYWLVLFPLDWMQQSYQVHSWSGYRLLVWPVKIHSGIKGFVTSQTPV